LAYFLIFFNFAKFQRDLTNLIFNILWVSPLWCFFFL
jgi:hypothetical protein